MFELNALHLAGTIGEEFEKVRVPAAGTPVHDINGAVLFHRLALGRGQTALGYADIAVEASLGEPLLAVSSGFIWDEKALLADAEVALPHGVHAQCRQRRASSRSVSRSFSSGWSTTRSSRRASSPPSAWPSR